MSRPQAKRTRRSRAKKDVSRVGRIAAGAFVGHVSILVAFSMFVLLAPRASYAAFGSPVSYDVGSNPRSVFAADLDGDGDRDLAVANYNSNTVSVLLNNGDVTFAASVHYAVGSRPSSVFAADLDGDADLDLAAANFISDSVSVLLNNGDGTFAAAVDYASGDGAWSVFAADLDGDGDRDFAVTNSNAASVSVLLNNGDGTFAVAVTYGVLSVPSSVHAVDVDGDTDPDLIVADYFSASVSVLLNNGDGTFAAAVHYGITVYPIALDAADLDGDGDVDIATANYDDYNVSVLLNNGDGTFASPVNYAVGTHPPSVFTADLDGDGDRDLVTANYDSDNVSVLLNNGDGTFAAAVHYSAGSGPWSAFPADLDGDNDVDLAVANYDNAKVSILFSDLNDVVAFQLTDPGDMAAGTRLAYVVSRVDQGGDPVTTGSDTVYLYTDSSGSGSHFYDAASGGSAITSRTIGPGDSSAAFWYADDAVGDWTVSASDNAAAPDGAVGIDDDADAVAVSAPPTEGGTPARSPEGVSDPTLEIPNEIEAYFEDGECSPDVVATLYIHAHSTGWYRFGDSENLAGLPWLNFDGTAVQTDITFPEEDGTYVTYFQLRSPTFFESPVQQISIRIDRTTACTEPPHEHELREGRLVGPGLEEACVADFEHALLEPYLVPYLATGDGRAITPGTPAVRTESPSARERSYAFDVDGDHLDDALVHVEHFQNMSYVHVRMARAAGYALRAKMFAGDIVVDDQLLWEDVGALPADAEKTFDLDRYKEICAISVANHPHPGDLVQSIGGTRFYIATDFKRHPFPDDDTFASWFGADAPVRIWPSYVLAHFPMGQNVTIRPGSRAVQVRTTLEYHLVAQQRTLRRVLSEGVLQALFGPTWAQTSVWLVNTIFFGDYTIGQNVADVATVEPVPSEITIDQELGLQSLGELLDEHSAFPSDGAP